MEVIVEDDKTNISLQNYKIAGLNEVYEYMSM
jgi:hypothetical protein